MINKQIIIEYLNRAYELTKIKQRLEREYEQKQKEVGSISINNSEIKRSKIISKVENKALDLVSLEKGIDLHNVKIEEVKREISCVIDKIEDDTLKILLRLRYLEFKKWEDIAYILNYTKRHIHRKHIEALEEILKKYNK